MTLLRPLARSARLRESYIEISRYIRSLHHPTPSNPSRRFHSCQRYLTTTTTPRDSTAAVQKLLHNPIGAQDVKTPQTEELAILSGFEANSLGDAAETTWESLRKTDLSSASSPDEPSHDQTRVSLYGYLTSCRSTRQVDFLQLVDPRLELAVQVILSKNTTGASKITAGKGGVASNSAQEMERRGNFAGEPRSHTAVQVSGTVVPRLSPAKSTKPNEGVSGVNVGFPREELLENTIQRLDPFVGQINLISHVEVQAEEVRVLGSFPPDLIAKSGTVFPPELRHLQFRTDHELRQRIRLRSRLAGKIRAHMLNSGFDEVETPLLFKSTPEGAREFIVPTRTKGMAYALPQSPQQYKQVLMASGISRYFQFARCFRDEDLRADRQPEFTQLDLEMGFAGSAQVMKVVEDLVLHAIWPSIPKLSAIKVSDSEASADFPGRDALAFPKFTYQEIMTRYGSDKPDIRLGSEIRRVEEWLPPNVKGMLTSLEDPVLEMIKIDMQGTDPAKSDKFVREFLDSPSKAKYANDEARIPGVAVYNPLMPLRGLASFGHEGAAKVEEELMPEPGDILVVYTRSDAPFSGGSTTLGELRRDLYQSAISQELIPAPGGFAALWVTDFPLFSPIEETEPGQGGSAGICSTHHPFTAPKQGQDLSLLLSDPLSVIGDHYDLVINGVEVGGGSRRIHNADVQEFIFRDVLKMKSERVEDFRHLLNALRAGCPPHAGFALGFDRLVAMLTNKDSVRDVIAFPKYADGEDKFAGSPSQLTPEQLATYHLAVVKGSGGSALPISRKA